MICSSGRRAANDGKRVGGDAMIVMRRVVGIFVIVP